MRPGCSHCNSPWARIFLGRSCTSENNMAVSAESKRENNRPGRDAGCDCTEGAACAAFG